MLSQLIANFAVVGLFAALWINFQDRLVRLPENQSSAVLGIVMGLAAFASVLISVEIGGYLVDLRAVPIAIAALLGGWIGGLAATAIAAGARLIAGGPGAGLGVLSIGLAGLAGLAGYALLRLRGNRGAALASTALLTGFRMFFVLPFLPVEARTVLMDSLVVTLPITIVGVVAIGFAIQRGRDRAEQRALLLGAVAQAPDFFYVKDVHSRIVAANRNVAEVHGLSDARQLDGMTDLDLESSERAAELLAEEHEVMASGTPLVDKAEDLVDDAGHQRSYVTSKSPVYAGSGNLIGLVGVTKDVSRLKELQRELQDGRDRLAFVLQEMSDGVALYDQSGHILLANDRYRELFPRTGHLRVAGAFLPTILQAALDSGEQPSASSSNHREWMAEVMATLRTGGDELVQLFDGRWLQLRTRVHSGGIATMVASDITSIKRAEIDLLVMTKQLEVLSVTDGLTQLLNRRGFDETLKKEYARAKRTDKPLSVILLDLDRFKTFNDRYGHLEGDECLRRVGAAVARAVNRPGDLVARYGGEEIAVILPDTTPQGAFMVAENIRHEIRGLVIPHEGSEKGIVTASLGIGSADPLDPAMSEQLLLAHADEALYLAKSGGRDRAIIWSDATVAPIASFGTGRAS